MNNLDEIEKVIQATLAEIPGEAATGGWRYARAQWTHAIKDRLRNLAMRFECRAVQGEWLYDIYWYVMSRGDAGDLVRLPLIGECEWTPDPEMDGDFQKLVQARAEHRLWIFQAASPDAIAEYFSACRKQVGAFTGTLPGDRYLFAGIDRAHEEFRFEHYVAP